MRPLTLEVAGFTCFKEPQRVDFTELELFAIQGQTGAGKSSLLDAITYALYGETSRLGSKGLEALVSQGATGMYVTLEFESSGQQYRVSRVWSLKASERQVRFERRDGERWVSAVEGVKVKDAGRAIEAAIGLDFDGFTRAVLLPQGEFDRFLRGDAKERRELLRGLLSLHHFERMRERANEQAREAKARIEQLEVLLTGEYAGATGEAIEAVHQELISTRQALETANARLEVERAERDALREGARLARDLETARAERTRLEARTEEVNQARERAVGARLAANVLPRLEVLETARKAEIRAGGDLQRLTLALEGAQQAWSAAQSREQKALEAAAELPTLERRLLELRDARAKMERLRALGGDLDLEIEEPTAFSEALMAQLETLRARLPVWNRAVRDLRDLERDVREKALECQRLEAEVRDRQTEQADRLERGTRAKERVETLERELVVARREAGSAEVTRDLKIGDPCPVCGSPLKRLPPQTDSKVPGLEQDLQMAREERQKLREEYSRLGEALKNATTNLERAGRELERFQKQRTSIEAERGALGQEFIAVLGASDDPVQALEAARERLLAGLAEDIRELTGGLDPERLTHEITARRKRLQTDLEEARAAAEKARATGTTAQANLEAAERTLLERQQDALEREREFEQALGQTGFPDAEAVRAAALSETEIRRLETADAEHREALTQARSRETSLLEAIGGRPHDPERLAALEQAVRELEEAVRANSQHQGRLETTLRDLERRRERAAELRRDKASLEKQYDVYAALALELRSDNFQEYLLSAMQRELLARASTIMREITRDRYRLELVGGEYAVLDAWNGLETRSVRTLSGGESFIASLSLALALSDELAGHKSLGALFLDEGFGTLDVEALDAVAAVLETIQTQGRMVGVITHVTSLAERLPNRLIVEKGPISSRVRWEAS